MQILFRYFSIRLGIEKVPMPFSKRLLKISKVPAIKTGTRLTLQRKKQHKFSSFSRQTFNCYTPTHLFLSLIHISSAWQRESTFVRYASSTFLLICFTTIIFLIATGSILSVSYTHLSPLLPLSHLQKSLLYKHQVKVPEG